MEFNYMKQQDWIDFFQAVHGRNPSIQEMAEAANRGEFVWETPKQTVKATKKLSQKETVEKTQNSETYQARQKSAACHSPLAQCACRRAEMDILLSGKCGRNVQFGAALRTSGSERPCGAGAAESAQAQ